MVKNTIKNIVECLGTAGGIACVLNTSDKNKNKILKGLNKIYRSPSILNNLEDLEDYYSSGGIYIYFIENPINIKYINKADVSNFELALTDRQKIKYYTKFFNLPKKFVKKFVTSHDIRCYYFEYYLTIYNKIFEDDIDIRCWKIESFVTSNYKMFEYFNKII